MPLKPFRPTFEPLEFPSEDGTKTYKLKPVSLKASSTFLLSTEPDSGVNITGIEQQELLLGPMRAEMIEDGASADYVWRVFQTAAADVMRGRAIAELIWETSGDPKEQAALKAHLESLYSPTTEADDKTPSPASTSSTTNSRPSSKPSPKGSRSRGGNSSKAAGTSSTATS